MPRTSVIAPLSVIWNRALIVDLNVSMMCSDRTAQDNVVHEHAKDERGLGVDILDEDAGLCC